MPAEPPCNCTVKGAWGKPLGKGAWAKPLSVCAGAELPSKTGTLAPDVSTSRLAQ